MISIKKKTYLFLLALFLVSCAGTQQSREQPQSLSQKRDEVGQLLVGRVVSVERMKFLENEEMARRSTDFAGSMYGVAGYLIGPLVSYGQHGNWYFHHGVKLTSNDLVVYRDEFYEYAVGECVALREKPFMLVPAYPSACEK